MSGTLSPDVIAAINKVAATPLGRKYDRKMRARYKKSGVAIAAKTILGESGGDRNAVSSAGARDLTQFMPGTRADYKKKYGIDAWGTDAEAVEAMMRHHLNTGIEGYNPGMPTYKDYILNQRLDPSLNRQLKRRGGPSSAGGQMPTSDAVPVFEQTTPGQSFEAERMDAKRNLLLGGDVTLKRLLDYKRTMGALQDVPGKTTRISMPTVPDAPKASANQRRGNERSSTAGFKISGPQPQRLKPELVSFARKVARVYGKTLTGLDGSTHSRLTVDGRVSEHSTGNATDIFEKNQKNLLRMGRAALIAAGMPRSQAMAATGGLYNVGNHQIIFLTNEGGNHFDHLHISARKRAR